MNFKKNSKICRAALVSLLAILASSAVGEECWRNDLREQNLVLRAAVWDAERSNLYLTDAFTRRTLAASWRPDGSLEVTGDFGLDLKPTATAKSADGGFIQIDNTGVGAQTIYWLDSKLKSRGYVKLQDPGAVDLSNLETKALFRDSVVSIFDWTPVGDKIFAYGNLGDPDQLTRMDRSFFIHVLRSVGSHNIVPKAHRIKRFPHPEYYVLGFPYMATIGDTVYFMTLWNYPDLYSYDMRRPMQGAIRLRVDDIPVFENPVPPIDNLRMYESIDEAAIPAGLYAHEGFLWVLYREPLLGGKNINWRLFKLDPDREKREARNLGEVKLPIQVKARHVTLLPLPMKSSWEAFEIGRSPESEPWKRGKLLAAVTIPQSWIDPENLDSPLLPAKVDRDLCRLKD